MNNFKKLFFVLSFSFVFTLVFAPVIVSAQSGTCTDSGYCNSLGASINTCSGQCKLEGVGVGLQQCVPLIACSTITTATACSSSAPACAWNLPIGTGTNVPPGGSGQNPPPSSNLKLDNPLDPLDEGVTINSLVGRVINSLMGIVGSLALLMFVYGGLIWMTSSGSQDKVKKGKDILVWSAVGLIVIFSAYALTKFIINLAT